MTGLTVVATALIAAPTGIWFLGGGPSLLLATHTTALILTVRVYAVAASIAGVNSIWLLGLFSGLLGGLLTELALHLTGAFNLATAFSAYASFGSELYRLDVLSRWWPFLFVGISGVVYSGLAVSIGHLVRYRHRLLGFDFKTR